jgi:hypothetical protein
VFGNSRFLDDIVPSGDVFGHPVAHFLGRAATRLQPKPQHALPGEAGKLDSTATVLPLGARTGQTSTDAGDVSWNVPMIGFRAATFVPGVVAHTPCRRPQAPG